MTCTNPCILRSRIIRYYTFAATIKDRIFVRGWDDKLGGYFKDMVPFNPTLFVSTNQESEYKSLTGQNVKPVKPGSISECRGFIDDYRNVEGMQVYGMERFLYQYLAEEFDEVIEYDTSKIKLWSLDIETTAENGFPKPQEALEEILLITLKNFNTKQTITFGSRPYTPKRDDVNYVLCDSEYELLMNFIAWWEEVEPEIITGWNVELFDITYICNRIKRVCGEKKMKRLSPWNMVSSRMIDNRGRKDEKFEIVGVSIIDYMDLYKKFTYTNQESYRLDHIANVELGARKLDHSEFETFKDFYTHGWEKFVDYNLIDVDLVDQLEEKMKLIDLIMLMAYDAHCNYIDTFAQVRLWDVLIYGYLRRQNIVLDLLNPGEKADQFVGAYVKEPKPGGYDWVVSWDLNSLYPSLIRFLNISPETLLDEKYDGVNMDELITKDIDISTSDDVCVAANGSQYRKDMQGMMPKLVVTMYNERVQFKKQMLKYKQKQVDIESEMKKRGLL